MHRTHIIICLCLFLLVIPVYLIDNYTLKSSGGNWISLDFRGVFIKAYLLLLSLHIVISTVAVFNSKINIYTVHVCSFILSIVIIGAGLFFYDKAIRNNSRKEFASRMEERKSLIDNVQLKNWWYVPDENDPKEIHATVFIKNAGRFAGSARMYDAAGNTVFVSKNDSQFVVNAAQNTEYVFSLDPINPDTIYQVELTFYYFKGAVGEQTKEDVVKIFMKDPLTKDDGNYFYETLPAPIKITDKK